MAQYLLKAGDESMARWKQEAKDRGYSFADFVRGCLQAECAEPEARKRVPKADEVRVTAATTPLPTTPRADSAVGGKRTFEPDWKGGKKP
jgi:hypothetical protein